jgi:hypothetical protein
MKVLLTHPAFLHADLCFDGRFCKSIVFYYEMNVFFYRIFAMLLRHAEIIEKMYSNRRCCQEWERYVTKLPKNTVILERQQTTIKLGINDM